MIQERLDLLIAKLLNDVTQKEVFPEKLPFSSRFRGGEVQKKPLSPEHRLAMRLHILCAVKAWEASFMKEILADKESFGKKE